MRTVSTLVTDLDNTLWDWFEVWHAGFAVLLAGLVEETGLHQDVLEAEIRAVHQANGTSEYPPELLLPLLPSLGLPVGPDEARRRFGDVLHAFYSARKHALRLYPGVRETLETVKKTGARVVAYTESLAFVSASRIRRLELDGVIDAMYSPPDHDFPEGVTRQQLRLQDPENYTLLHTQMFETPAGHRKPETVVLDSILDRLGVAREEAVYVGDSVMKDVQMARAMGVTDAWAEYGKVLSHPGYDLLRRVSHWTDEDVERERELEESSEVTPSVVLKSSLGELLDHFAFDAGEGRL